eukprot:GHVU01053173.1.p2 GENE.GHVU01053173.1~~GHVU01053173.1.p2  ORF type:complete len:104 (+),score=12.00 GHVU01053173.1:71-382(+)
MPDQIRASHIILKHTQSRNPVSRRDNKAVTRTLAEATQMLKDAGVTPENFKEKARDMSECNSYRQDGDLGMFGKGQMDAAFEKAAFALDVGQMSGIVESASGK